MTEVRPKLKLGNEGMRKTDKVERKLKFINYDAYYEITELVA